jgi:simple sugar transport system permease protein
MTTSNNETARPLQPLDDVHWGERLQNFARTSTVFVLLAAMIVGFSIAQPAFIQVANQMSILQAVSVVAILGAVHDHARGRRLRPVDRRRRISVMASSYAMVVWGWT